MARAAAAATAMALTVLATTAHAQPAKPVTTSTLQVTARRCTWLDDAELERLTRLELGGPAGAVHGGLGVDFSCAGDDVTIGLSSETTAIRVERLVTGACCDDVEPERTLALLSLGLFTAARALLGTSEAGTRVAGDGVEAKADGTGTTVVLPAVNADGTPVDPVDPQAGSDAPAAAPPEVLMPAPAPAAVPYPAPTMAPVTPFRAPAPDRVAPPAEPPIHELGLAARLRLFNLTRPVPGYAAAASYRAWPWSRIGFGAWFEAAFGSARRRGGEIDARVLALGASAQWRAFVVDPFTLRLEGRGGLSHVHLAGETTEPTAFGQRSTDGVTGSLAFVVAPTLRSGATSIALPLEIGGLFRAPRGEVAGDDPVQLDGAVFSAGLAVSYGFGARDDARREASR